MRLAGWFFLVAGLLLCLTVAWATVGFLLMGVGLVALRSAERQRQSQSSPEAAAIRDTPSERLAAVTMDTPVVTPYELPIASSGIVDNGGADDGSGDTGIADNKAVDTARWRELMRDDPEIARFADILAPYGADYVEQFASDYLAVSDKSALPAIIDRIIVRVSADKATADRLATPDIVEPRRARPEPLDIRPGELRSGDVGQARRGSRVEPMFDAEGAGGADVARAPAVVVAPVMAAAPVEPVSTPVKVKTAKTRTVAAEPVPSAIAQDVPTVSVSLENDIASAISKTISNTNSNTVSRTITEKVPNPVTEKPAQAQPDIAVEPQVQPHAPSPERAASIASTDDALAELFEKFAPDSRFLKDA